MARVNELQPLVPSVLDRLIDDEPHNTKESFRSQTQILREMKNSVRRDLENLLNTHIYWYKVPEHYTELDVSLVNYGLPDFSSASMSSQDSRLRFCKKIQETIMKFEPRFKRVNVDLLNNSEPLDRTLRLRIDALLDVDPEPEPIIFDSVMEPINCSLTVKENRYE
ncbi:MAG: type VI secretion system baseplate subunit TssE [Gammaproteobacteria bacterium]|nr:MAG: type VI secretion system baseplate subunit TssE [Gammaproteobacteria bacterium]